MKTKSHVNGYIIILPEETLSEALAHYGGCEPWKTAAEAVEEWHSCQKIGVIEEDVKPRIFELFVQEVRIQASSRGTFKLCPIHPEYRGKGRPTTKKACACKGLWEAVQKAKVAIK